MPRRPLLRVAFVVLALGCAEAAHAATNGSVTLTDLTRSAARVFRGRCLAAEVGTAAFAGARIPATTYTFEVSEYLKGSGPDTLSFRQVGTPMREPNDLGRVAGLPVYAPGGEYIIFLLPESKARLTSPAGAERGVFTVSGDQVKGASGVRGMPAAARPAMEGDSPPDPAAVPYEAFRRAVLQAMQKPRRR